MRHRDHGMREHVGAAAGRAVDDELHGPAREECLGPSRTSGGAAHYQGQCRDCNNLPSFHFIFENG